MKHGFITAFLATIVFFSANARAAITQSNEFTLKNNLNVVVLTDKKVPAVIHMLWYKVGSADEKPGKTGLAHFFEHLMFKETDYLRDGEFSSLISYNGGNDNAFTMQDYTVYFQTIARNHLPLAMMLEADRMKNLEFDKEKIEREKKIILEERNMRIENNPKALLAEKMNSSLFNGHPYSTPIIGWKEDIENITADDLKEFYERYYRPDNVTLVVSGDITADELKPLAEKYYGSINNGEKEIIRADLEKPLNISKHYVSLEDKRVKNPEWVRYYVAPSASSSKSEHALPLVVLAQILGGGETSRLYNSLVLEKKLALDVSVYYDEMSLGKSTFSFQAVPGKRVRFEQIETSVEQEITNLIKNGINNEELRRAKNLLRAQAIYARDGFKNMAFVYGFALSTGLSMDYVENWPDEINKVTASQIVKAAKYILTEKNSVTGTLTEEKQKENDIIW